VAADVHVSACERESIAIAVGDPAEEAGGLNLTGTLPSVSLLWRKAEMSREITLDKPSTWRASRLRRRAFLVAKSLPVLPGQSVLELGAGSGAWTDYLTPVFAGQNPLTAVVFNESLARKAQLKNLLNTSFIHVQDVQSAFPPDSFDCVVGTDVLTDGLCAVTLQAVCRWLKPGGQFLFFAQNTANPLAFSKRLSRRIGSGDHGPGLQEDFTLQAWTDAAARHGFDSVEVAPIEVIPPLGSAAGQAVGLILERCPIARRFADVVSLRGTKPGSANGEDTLPKSLATHRQLFGTVSVVVPCHDEEANINRLVKTLLGLYGEYLHEIVIVDDNSTDRTADVAAAVANSEGRVKLVRRTPPAGVGRALRDGYAVASGKYILTIDCDFLTIAPEFKGLFDAVAEGYDGAIGSRFSTESALVRYPFLKIVCNRGYHLLLNLLLGKRVRDVSNNLKLYRADILKNLDIEEDHFAANVETGLKPLLMNYHVREVPTSWINRAADMGNSSFNLLKVGPDYLRVLLRTTWRYWLGQYRSSY
jgi:dolichol-phosphate mannosyltransferase